MRAALDAALDRPETDRTSFVEGLRAEDPGLADEVGELLRHVEESGDFLEAPIPIGANRVTGLGGVPERIGVWRLEREIGHGGMASVWLGCRDDGRFQQKVAIKLIRPDLASEWMRHRLAAETRIVASLDHEGIARLLDGGATEEGVPYLVLEFVDGDPIDAWCDARRLPLAGRLDLFLQVARAVEFAHRRLVLHRDLKAANVLVDSRGRAKLLDFGIAQILGPQGDGHDWTSFGFERPLTPEWASPEQLRGEELTTASDVYSMGVLLCVLITGRRPHRWTGQSPEAFARQIEDSGSPIPDGLRVATAPGIRSAEVAGDLERVVRKALAPELAHRYGSVAELAADVERFVAGQPVSAHPPSARYRLAKLLRRHRARVAAGLVALLSLMTATVVSLRQARIAERHFEATRDLANRFLFELEEAIRDLPGATRARERAVRVGLEYLDRLAREAADDRSMRLELAEGYLKLGDVQGGVDRANLGDAQGALTSYRKAIELLTPRPDETPDREEQMARVRAWTAAASIEAKEGESERALTRLTEAIELATALAAGRADDPEPRAARAVAHYRRATLLQTERSSLLDARAALDSALADAQAAAGAAGGGFERNEVMGRIHLGRGRLEYQMGDYAAARDAFERALAADRELLRERPTSALARQFVATDHVRLADALLLLGEPDLAAASAEEGLRRFEQNYADDPANLQAEYLVAWAANRLGDIRMSRGEFALAERAARRAREIMRAQLARDPTSPRNLWVTAISENRVASLETKRGDHERARESFGRAIESYRAAIAADPANKVYEIDLAATIGNLADGRVAAGDVEAARASYSEELAIAERLAGFQLGPRPDLVRIHALVGLAELDRRGGESAGSCARARAARDGLARVPEDPDMKETERTVERLLATCP